MIMKKYTILIRLISIFMISSQAFASTDIHAYINKVKAGEMQFPDPIPPFQHLVKFIYTENENRQSPFLLKAATNKVIKNNVIQQNLLHKTPLEDLRYAGMIKKNSKILALVGNQNGDLYGVSIGDKIGINAGNIVLISDNYLRVEESIFVAGKWGKRTKNLYFIGRD